MANMLERSLTPRPVSGPSSGGRGPQSGVDYFGDVGQRVSASLRRPGGVGQQLAPQQQQPSRMPQRVTQVDPGLSSPAAADREAPGAGMTQVDTTVPDMPGNFGQNTSANMASYAGRPDNALAQGIRAGINVARAVPGPWQGPAALVGGLSDFGEAHQRAVRDGTEVGVGSLVGMGAGIAGAPAGAARLGMSIAGTARRAMGDPNDPANQFSIKRDVVSPFANYALAQAPADMRQALGVGTMVAGYANEDDGTPAAASAEGTAVTTRKAINDREAAAQAAIAQAQRQQAAQAAIAQAQARARGDAGQGGAPGSRVDYSACTTTNLGLPNVPDSLPGGDPDFGAGAGADAAMASVRAFEARNTGRGGFGGRADGRGTSNSAHGGDAQAADGGMATARGFSRPGLPQANRQPRPMRFNDGGQVPMGLPTGPAPDERDVQTRVQQAMRDPQLVQQLIARPMALMESGELTPDEVMTLGRVAEAAMFNPALYPQLRAFVAQQGMTPLPAAFDPAVITNIMVISKALQAQMPATEPGMVPGMDQAQVEQPVPGFGNGGYIRGPGTGRSDSIGTVNESSQAPVKVATDEYIIPAHVVRAKGRDFFDGLLRRYAPTTQPNQE